MKKIGIVTIYTLILFVIKTPLFVQAATDIHIRHMPLFCVAAGLPAEVSFEVLSQSVPRETRVYFREQGTEIFYFTHGTRHGNNLYSAILPAPLGTTVFVEYFLLVVNNNEQAVKSSLFAMPVEEENMCPQEYLHEIPMRIVVSAEQEIEPNIGFEGEKVIWTTSADRLGTPYMENAVEKLVLIGEPATTAPVGQGAAEEQQVTTSGKKSRLGKKTLIGVGAGAGAVLLGAAVAGGGGSSDGGDPWGSIKDIAENVDAVLVKSPTVQTVCGTVVSNQLFLTNKRPESIMLGTIDFEVVLTRDRPSGTCAPGQTGAFAQPARQPCLRGKRCWSVNGRMKPILAADVRIYLANVCGNHVILCILQPEARLPYRPSQRREIYVGILPKRRLDFRTCCKVM